jgi:hypothetical protein
VQDQIPRPLEGKRPDFQRPLEGVRPAANGLCSLYFLDVMFLGILLLQSKFWPESLTGPKRNVLNIIYNQAFNRNTDAISGLHEKRGKGK